MEMILSETLQELLREVASVEGALYSPKTKAEPGDRVLGECDTTEQRLYGLGQLAKRESERAQLEWRHADDDTAEERAWKILIARHNQREKMFMALFWYLLQERLDIWGKSLALKAGWKVAEGTSAPPGIRGLLDLLGGCE